MLTHVYNPSSLAARARELIQPETSPLSENTLSLKIEQLWKLDGYAPDVPFVGTMLIKMGHGVDLGALRDSVSTVVDRHDALHCRLTLVDGHAGLTVDDVRPVELNVIRISNQHLASLREWGDQSLFEEFLNPVVNLYGDNALKYCVFMNDDGNTTFAMIVHHYFGDGWSQQILRREIQTCYTGFCANTPPSFTGATQFGDYAAHQRRSICKNLATELNYLERLVATLPTSKLPYDHNTDSGEMGRILFGLAEDATAGARRLAASNRVSLFVVFLAILQFVLRHWTGRRRIVTAVTCADRVRPEFQTAVGYIQAGVPVLTEFDDSMPLGELFASVANGFYSAFAHRDIPYELTEELFGLDDPVTTTLLNFVPLDPRISPVAGNSGARPPEGNVITPSVPRISLYRDIYVMLVELPEGMHAKLFYNRDRFTERAALMFISRFKRTIAAMIERPDCRLSELRSACARQRHSAEDQSWVHLSVPPA